MNCRSCGAELKENAKFCENCGASVEAVTSASDEQTLERVDAEIVGDANYADASDNVSDSANGEASDSSTASSFQSAYEAPSSSGDTDATSMTLSIISLVCGILSILCCCCSWFGIICAIAAVVLGIISINKNAGGRGMAIAGIVCGGIGFLIGLAFMIIAVASSGVSGLFNGGGFDLQDVEDFIDGL